MFIGYIKPCPDRAGFLFKLTLPVDILNGKRTLSNSRLWQEIISPNLEK